MLRAIFRLKRYMKKSLNILFVILGVTFLILILIGLGYYLSISMGGRSELPDSPKPLTTVTTQTDPVTGATTTTTTITEPESIPIVLSESQKSALRAVGIDPSTLPASISPEQVACFETKLGVARVAEIKAGSSPSPMDFLKAKSCI